MEPWSFLYKCKSSHNIHKSNRTHNKMLTNITLPQERGALFSQSSLDWNSGTDLAVPLQKYKKRLLPIIQAKDHHPNFSNYK